MNLIKLSLSNFQGIKQVEFMPNGKDASVYGDNAAGKTTLYNALTWLLFGKASTGEKGFSPKTFDENGEDVHNIENSVTAVFALDDGLLITLTKTLKEDWTNKRGSNIKTLTGNTTDYYIDGVPETKTQFDLKVAEICPPDKAQLLTQPDYFPKVLSWQERRKLIIDICGDVTDYDVINSSSELKEITQYLLKPGTDGQFYTVEEWQKIAGAKKKELNDRLKEIPARIDELSNSLPDITAIDEGETEVLIATYSKQRDEALVEKANIGEGAAVQALRQQLAELKTDAANAKVKFNENRDADTADDRKTVEKLQRYKMSLLAKKNLLESSVYQDGEKLNSMRAQRERMSKEYHTVDGLNWSGNTVCPTCGQALPSEKIEESRQKFNLNNSERKESIRARIENECSKVMIADLEQRVSSERHDLDDVYADIKSAEERFTAAQNAVNAKYDTSFEQTAEFAEYAARIAEISAKISADDTDVDKLKEAAQAKIDDVSDKLAAEQRKQMLLSTFEKQRQRIAELESQEKQLNAEYEEIEKGIFLCETFIKTKVSMLTEKINGKFKNLQFRLFDTQINAGIKECCEVMIPADGKLIPYASANNAAKINAGLEIIDTFAGHWGISMPVFVDNAESVTRLNKISAQVIRLVVSEPDKVLRTEVQ